jgi:hypothetical protein
MIPSVEMRLYHTGIFIDALDAEQANPFKSSFAWD